MKSSPSDTSEFRVHISPSQLEGFLNPPPVFPAPTLTELEGVRSLFFQGPPSHGKPTKVFAFYGVPKIRNNQVPGIVLVHGGSGTASADWVKLWNDRGYAAIAFDHFGGLPIREGDVWKRNPEGGPDHGDCEQTAWPMAEQWMYHAVVNALLATSLLGSLPGVDGGKIGLTGISWGGVVAAIVAGLDARLKFVIPVYGCGFISHEWQDGSKFVGCDKPPELLAKWREIWDPSHYLPKASAPILWVTGTNDIAFTLRSWQLSCRAAPGTQSLSIRLNMPHSHKDGGAAAEIAIFADSVVRGKPPLIRITSEGREGGQAWLEHDHKTPLKACALVFTRQSGIWQERRWEAKAAIIDAKKCQVRAEVPSEAVAWFFQLTDERGITISSLHHPEEEFPK